MVSNLAVSFLKGGMRHFNYIKLYKTNLGESGLKFYINSYCSLS